MIASIRVQTPCGGFVQNGKNRLRGPAPGWLWLMLLAAALVASGCGKSEPEPGSAASPAPSPAAEQQASKTPETPKPAAAAEEAPPEKPAEQPAAMAEEPAEPKPARPDHVIDWARDDYISAKEDRDPRLVDAVAFLAERGAGDEQTAQLLTELLTTVEDPEPDPKPQPKAEKPKPKPKPAGGGGADELSMEEPTPEMEEPEVDTADVMEEPDSPEVSDEEGNLGRREAAAPAPGVAPVADVTLLKPGYVSLIGAIVRALGANGTEASRRVLEQLLAGTIETGSDRLATSAALKALVDYRSAENQALLLRALTQSEAIRPAGQEPGTSQTEVGAVGGGKVTASQLRETALALVTETATPQMRMQLASYLYSPNPAVELRQRLVRFLMASHPYNVMPQVIIYQQPQTSTQVRNDFELFFTTYSSCALARLMGVLIPPQAGVTPDLQIAQADTGQAKQPWVAFGGSAPAAPPASAAPAAPGPQRTDRPKHASRAAAQIAAEEEAAEEEPAMAEPAADQTAPVEQAIEDQEGRRAPAGARDLGNWASGSGRKVDADSLAAFQQVAQSDRDLPSYLAGQLWSPKFSAAVAGELDRISSLESSTQLVNLATTIPTDAARRALCQALQAHSKEGPEGLLSAAALPEEGTVDPGFLAVVKTLPRHMPEKPRSGVPEKPRSGESNAEPEKPEQKWFTSSRALLRYLCDGFQKAAQATAGQEQTSAIVESFPVKIPEDAHVVAAYKLDWQADVGGKLSGAAVDPLVVHYVHIQDTTRYSIMLGRYRRAVTGGEVHEMDHVAWIDGYRVGSDPGRKRSVDVLITRLPENTDPRSTQDEALDVEILSIEINDPGQPQG